ncbi:hypothetical protein H0E84_15100 [Luteimonas sp. SJ-92]|uniref:Uncharacterized protein n=1 Tax=Luteimonas salinisoli TaxID=2752307 RepID=A0A853JGL3_9GAMM|nr:hypothetical protein [Luteimonas salinisoli]NZA27707.1 hypothetical protein [Luteimonas salinisoli]
MKMGSAPPDSAATGDVIAIGTAPLDDHSLPALGEVIFSAARQVRGLLDQVYAQRLAPAAAVDAPTVPQADHPAFASELHARLPHARSLRQEMKAAAAHRADGADDLAPGRQAVAQMLGGVIEGLEARFDVVPEEASAGR